MISRLLLVFFSTLVCCRLAEPPAAVSAEVGETQGTPGRAVSMTLAEVLSRVFESNPEITVSDLEIRAASARLLQAGLRPNPEVSAEVENLSTPGIGAGVFHFTESTLQFSQRMELGGKRDLRIRAAEKDVTVASSRLEVTKTDLMSATSQAFAEVLAEQERVANQGELARLAEQSHSIVVERVAAGKVSPVEQTRASVALASAQLEEERRRLAYVAAKDRLAALWGGTYRDIDSVQGAFEIPPAVSGTAEACIGNNAEMKLAAATVGSRDAGLAAELSSRKPDLTFSAGFRRLSLDNSQVWVAGVSIPLTIFDKRQGAVAEARIRLEQARAEEKVVERRLRAELAQVRHEHEIAVLEAKTLAESALPAAREAAAAVEEGYRLGKFDFLNVLDAQRTYAELQGRYIEAVASGMKAAVEIQRIARCDSPAAPPVPVK